MIEIKCRYDKLVPIDDIKPHPENENKHSEDQIRILAKIIKKDGVRHPITVSNLSGMISMGHGRLLAFKMLKMTDVPVEFQDFDDPIQEMRVRNSDNNIARYAEISRMTFNDNLESLGISVDEIDIEDYGILKFEVPEEEDQEKDKETEIDIDGITSDLNKQCPKCGFEFEG